MRPNTVKKHKVGISLTNEIYELVKQIAELEGRSISNTVEQLIKRHLNENTPLPR